MKKQYPFLHKYWLLLSLGAAFAANLPLNLQAQTAPVIQWDKTFGGSGDEWLTCMKQTSDGGYILGGWSTSGISGDKSQASKGMADYWVVKIDANGNKTWDKTIGGNNDDGLLSLQQTSDGGYILGGSSDSGISGDKSQTSRGVKDYWIVKLDANGNKLWDKTFGGNGDDYLSSLQQTSDGGYILGGESDSGISGDKSQASKGNYDQWVIKLDASGNKLWDKAFGGNSSDRLACLQQTADGGYIQGGLSDSGISGDKTQAPKGYYDYWVVKLDASGNKLWDRTLGGNWFDEFLDLQQTSDGGYILGGFSDSDISGDKSQPRNGPLYSLDYWIIKLDASGNKTWDKTIGGNGQDLFLSLQQTADFGYIIGGHSDSGISGDKSQASIGSNDFWVVKLDFNGNKTWDKTIGGSSGDELMSLQQTSDGGYILGGRSYSNISGDKTQINKGPANTFDYWIVKIGGNPVGIKETETNFAVSISPNPNQGKFTLQLSNLTAPKAKVTVSDLLGRVVLQQPLTVSNNQLSEELTLPNAKGMYLLQIKVGEQLITRKIVVE